MVFRLPLSHTGIIRIPVFLPESARSGTVRGVLNEVLIDFSEDVESL